MSNNSRTITTQSNQHSHDHHHHQLKIVNTPTSTKVCLIAGSVGGAMQVLVGQPLDTIKTRSQISPNGMFRGPLDITLKTINNEGFLALYKGMLSPLLGVAAVNSLLFGSYSISKKIISPYPDLTLTQTTLAGSMAGAINSILASPVEMFKIKMQAQYGSSKDLRLSQIVLETWSKFGFRNGIMRGFWITVIREIPAYAGFYGGFEITKRSFKKHYDLKDDDQLPIWTIFLSGAIGGLSYWTCCYPLDVIKSKVQMSNQSLKGINYIFEIPKQIILNEGFRGLLKGIIPTYIRAIPAAASTFVGYELTVNFFKN